MIQGSEKETKNGRLVLSEVSSRMWGYYWTNNNMFILRAAIDRARADQKVLYVAFIDLINAFPSTDPPTL